MAWCSETHKNNSPALARWAGLWTLLLTMIVSCTADHGKSVAAGGEPGPTRATTSASMPASLRFAAIRAMQKAEGYDFAQAGEVLTARAGMGKQAEARVSREGVTFTPMDKSFSLGMRTTQVGRTGTKKSAPRVAGVHAEKQEAVIDRDGIQERYLAGPLGLEQSYRIDARPEGQGPIVIDVAFEGLAPKTVEENAAGVQLVDAQGTTRAVYRDLAAIDAKGRELAAHMQIAGGTVTLVVEDEGAAYPVEIDPLIATLEARLLASDGATDSWFGYATSLAGDTAIVGAIYKTVSAAARQGEAYVFVRSGTTWTEQAKLLAGDGAAGDFFGASVGLSGDTAIVGARGKVVNGNATQGASYVFVRSGTTWGEQAKLVASDGAAYDQFGTSGSLSGDTAIVGASTKNLGARTAQGASYVFVRSGTTWTEQAKLLGSDGAANDYFGASVSLSGDTAIVGALVKTVGGVSGQGEAYVFVRSGTTWTEQATLLAKDGTPSGEYFGGSVSLSGDTVLIGAQLKTVNGKAQQGQAYVFVRSVTTWTEQAKLLASDGAATEYFGNSVSLSGDTALVGAIFNTVSGNARQGAAYLYVRSGTTWTEQSKVVSNDGAANDYFGESVSLSGDTAIVGARGKTVNGNAGQGAAYAFRLTKGLGTACGASSECGSGFCIDGVCCNTACAAGVCDACSVAAGAAVGGTCSLLTGTVCNDANPCTQTDTCQTGVCTGASPVTCATPDQCHTAGTCIVATGVCSNPRKANGTVCDDTNANTAGDVCTTGTCAGVDHCVGVTCSALDQCHTAGTCIDHATGACSNPLKANGTVCSDANPCTQTDTCQTGVCTGASTVICSASDQCHAAGTCNPGNGTCSNPSKTDGTACDDTNANTTGDVCTTGTCAGVDHCVGVTCSALDQCHTAGTCIDHATGDCSNPAKADATPCNDGTVCTQNDTCQSGSCTGSNPVTCAAPGACQETATCDATLGCVYASKTAGTECSAAVCVSGGAQPAGLCDGTSAGCPATTPVDCGSYTCESGACSTTCTGCTAEAYCDQGSCLPKHAQGGTCSTTANCLAGSCIDGVCCESTCTGQCEACDVSGHEGTCWPTTGAPHGGRTACSTDTSSCGGVCDGTLRTSCTYPTTSCRDASCEAASNVATLAANCDGQGSCPGLQTVSCTPNLCGATACNGDCAQNTDCAEGNFCAANVCTPKIAAGTTCGGDTQCISGTCVDGVCCESACQGQCQACNEPNQAGTCVTVAGAPRSGRPACSGTGDCQGTCDGTAANYCSMPDTSKTCAAGTCASGTATAASTCDGMGTCQAGMETSCGAYTCGTDTCKTTCTVVEDCAAGYDCAGDACVVVEQDAGAEAGEDAADDAPPDAGDEASADAETDATAEASVDAGSDAAEDATAEASAEASVDATTDAIAEASAEAGVDAGAENDTLEAGDVPAATTPASDSGCGCRLAGTTPLSGRVPALALLALAGAVVVRRRRNSL